MRDEAGITELRLGPPPAPPEEEEEEEGFRTNKKRVFSEVGELDANSSTDDGGGGEGKVAVVGWPPVCAYRKKSAAAPSPGRKAYVKVSMDGTPILRKVELRACKGYADLTAAIERLFCHGGATLSDDSGGWKCTQIYEDEDGDWMLVGDVPWDMFTESCRRLRVVKQPVAPWNY